MADTEFIAGTVITHEWLNDINDHAYNSTPIAPATAVHQATSISNAPAGTLSATNVQDAIEELDNEKLSRSGGSMAGAINEAVATVASNATTSDIWSAAGNSINFTGSATVTNFPTAPQAGSKRLLHCDTGVTFTNNINITVQGNINYTTQSGDLVLIEALTTNTFKATVFRSAGVAVNPVLFASSLSSTQSVTSNVDTVVQLSVKEYDTHTAFDTSTFRFIAPKAGYYTFVGNLRAQAASALVNAYVELWKNGAALVRGDEFVGAAGSSAIQLNVIATVLLAANDYIELSGKIIGTTPAFGVGTAGRAANCWLEGRLVG